MSPVPALSVVADVGCTLVVDAPGALVTDVACGVADAAGALIAAPVLVLAGAVLGAG
ncbi:MAG: hypothetical protein JO296_17975 [Pseudonocardiales bacterium]|nr:hypothetical protein [Pseudonocardiales bacterium]MBV9652007.1 hypothetical protein [Pseudonocardiales bacterium]